MDISQVGGYLAAIIAGIFGVWQLYLKNKQAIINATSQERLKNFETELAKITAQANAQKSDDVFRDKLLDMFGSFSSKYEKNTEAVTNLTETIAAANASRDKALASIVEEQMQQTQSMINTAKTVAQVGSEVHDTATKVGALPDQIESLKQSAVDNYEAALRTVTNELKEIEATLKEQRHDFKEQDRRQIVAINEVARGLHNLIKLLESLQTPLIVAEEIPLQSADPTTSEPEKETNTNGTVNE